MSLGVGAGAIDIVAVKLPEDTFPRFVSSPSVTAIFLAGFFAAVTDVGAAIIFGNTTGQPTWTRVLPGSPPDALSIVGTDVPFETIPFTVSVDGLYDFSMKSLEPADRNFDTFLALYLNTFDPGNPLTDVLLAADDLSGTDAGFTEVSLSQGNSYLAVATGFDNIHFGFYEFEITGPGEVNVIPEPSAALLCLCSCLGSLLRRTRGGSLS